ncbi:phage tail sheath family protein [Paenibacillus terreus]|uniref:Phage tail sheath family protein n=1 Tax=Paenibacillus terreus TaxID=1387834 RepID=A0ABV5B1N5_9BACL
MAGGTWTVQNKVRPGVYINFVSEANSLGTLGERGTVSMALPLSWGEPKKIITIQAGEDLKDKLGYDITSSQMLVIRETLKRAKTLLLYRLNEGVKASATIGTLLVTAVFGGIRGNDISIVITPNINDDTKFDVETFLAGERVDVQSVASLEELENNKYVVFQGEGQPELTAGAPLKDGTDGTVSNQDHTSYLQALEVMDFQAIALVSDDAALKSVYSAYVKRLRETEGKKIQAVLADYTAADHEGIISVKNGVTLTDGTVLYAKHVTAWVAGATAGAAVNESLTYQAYDDAADVNGKLTNAEMEAALKQGQFVFTASNGKAVVEQDINTFTSLSPDKAKHFSKNRVVRVLDSVANDLKRIFESYFIGKVNNNDDGRNLFRSQCVSYLNDLQNIGAVQNFNSQTDIQVLAGAESDSIVVELSLQPVDSVEKVYMKVKVA